MANFSPKSRESWQLNCLDPYFFCTTVLAEAWSDKYRDFGSIHRQMLDFLNLRTNPGRRKYLSAFRGSFKTTVLLGFMAWLFIHYVNRGRAMSMIYNTATKDNAHNFQADFRHAILENQLLQWIYPNIPSDEKKYRSMTKDRIQIGEVKCDFASLEMTLVSRHYPLWFNDDLENDENSRTEYQREDLKRKWRYQKAILTRIHSRNVGLEVETGTPYHVQGLTWQIRNNTTFDKIEIPCYIGGDKEKGVTFPELYTVEDFEQKRLDMTPSIFSAQYLLKPIAEEDALCREEWIRERWKVLPELRWRTCIIDPGGAEPGASDPTGITILDTDENGMSYVVYARKEWFTPVQLIDKIIWIKDNFDPDDIRVEKDHAIVTIADTLIHKFPMMRVSYVEHRNRSKGDAFNRSGTRIWRLRQWFQTKRIMLGDNQSELEEDLLIYPEVKYDDLLDSLAYHLDIIRTPVRRSRLILPSGREFRPNVEASFEAEIERVMSAKNERALANDKIY